MNLQDELTLLRRFEPVLRFTRGENFFPMDVELFVRNSSLWVQRPNAEPALLVAQDAQAVFRPVDRFLRGIVAAAFDRAGSCSRYDDAWRKCALRWPG